MPKSCCVPLCPSTDRNSPSDHYFEIPSNVERRAAWLKRISRQGTAKGSPWQPASRSVVCSRHFIDKDYREGCKRKLLRSSAIPTVFPEYPSYLQGGDCPKRRKLSRQENDETQSDRRSNQERANENDSQHADDRSDRVDEPPAETDPETEPSEETTTTDQESQTVLNVAAMLEENKRNTHRLQVKVNRLNCSMQKLQEKCDELSRKVQEFEQNKAVQALKNIFAAADRGDKTATFVRHQIMSFGKTRPSYEEHVLRECVLWKACSSKGYEHVKARKLFKLPCRSTLQKFVGRSTGEVGVTTLIKDRLRAEFQALKIDQERHCSLIIDEMAIQQKVVYDRQVDKIFGLVDMGIDSSEASSSGTPQVANRLLCFVIRGLSTAYIIPVGYFFTRCLRNDELKKMTLSVMQAIEDAGFHVTRIVTDNHKTNAALFRSMSEDKTLQHVIAHPFREDDPLFLSFDPNHLIKNLRTNLLERSMFDGDEEIQGGLFLKELYDIQSGLLVKPVRFLTRAHVDPSNLEKMKVSRATLLFSPVVIGTLEYLKENPSCHERAPIFEGCGATVRFMRAIGKWYALHNIGGWTDRHDQEQPFITTDDERLSWLEVDFVEYMEHLRTSGDGARNRCMTKETYEATMMTTRSTVALAEYLLDNIK